ncbi:MAG: 4-hydroxy-tetrahydrodipicolinate synthase [Methanothrix sp.]|jgi:4-hydroxy-tetrahydrodipicolinate synthase|nr:MAG: 4-hydroxy-tetrahydrodipicolinate synthase [Methanothrix sp.]
MFEGLLPALITPFKEDGELDEEGFRENIDFFCEAGVHGIVPCGTTGESATLSFEEHKTVVEVAVDSSKVPVVAGTGSNNTREAVELTRHAEDAGASAALLITPYYNRPNDRGMMAHFRAVAEGSEIPLILYNVPSRTGINLKPELVAELARIENVAGIKEASGNLSQVSKIIELTRDEDFVVLSGDDVLTLPIMALGGRGVISVTADLAPRKMVAMVEAMLKGDLETARKIHYSLSPLVEALFLETNPIPVKAATRMIGLAAGPLRLPLAPISEMNEKKLKEVVDLLGEFR